MVRTTHSTRKFRSIWSNPVISWNGSSSDGLFLGREIPSLNVFSSFMIYESSPQPITWNKLYTSNASPENSSPKKALRKDRSIFNSKNWSCHRRNTRPANRVRISSLNLCQNGASFLKSHHKVKNASSSISKWCMSNDRQRRAIDVNFFC